MRQFYLLFLSMSFVFFGFFFKNNPNDSAAVHLEKTKLEVKKPTPPKKRMPLIFRNNASEVEKQSVNFFAPGITVSKSVAVQGGGNATIGGQLNYTISLSNSASVGAANNATAVSVTDILSSDLTLVSGSLKATPIAVEDSYNATGNVGITVSAASGLLTNDVSPDGTAITVAAGTFTGSASGTFVIATDGSFTYINNPGFTGTETYTYTLNSTNGTSTTAIISIVVTNTIWFINSAYGGGSSNGTLAKPFTSINAFQSINNAANTNSGEDGDWIYVYAGTYSAQALTLRNSQKFFGESSTNSFLFITGITTFPYTNTTPLTNSSSTTSISNTTSTPITLGNGNLVRGFSNISTTSATTMTGASVGALTVRDVSLNATAGQALLITSGGALDIQFKSISAAGAAKGISVNGSTGSFQILGTGTTAGSGGTISNITNRGAEFISVASVTLKNMNFVNANTAAGTCANAVSDNTGCNAGIHLKSISGGVTMDNIQMNTSLGNKNEVFGINMNAVNGFSLANSTITRCGTDNQEACLLAVNTTGTCTISNSILSKSSRCARFYNTNSNMTLKVTGSSFNDTRTFHDPPTPTDINTYGNAQGESGIAFNGYGSSDMKLDVSSSCQFLRIATGGIDVTGADNTLISADVQNNTFNSTNANLTVGEDVGRGVSVVSSGNAVMKFNIKNNAITGRGGDLINIGTLSGGTNSTEGTIEGNTITYNFQSTVNNNAGNGIGIVHVSSATNSKVRVHNNTITGIRSAFGIDALVQAGTCNVVYTNNNVTVSGVAYDGSGAPGSQPGSNYAMRITSSVSGATVCSRVANNTVTAGLAGYAQMRASVTGAIQNYEGSPTTNNWDASNPHTNVWNFNSNTPTITSNVSPTFVSVGGSGTKNIVPSGTCLLPSNPSLNLRIAAQEVAHVKDNEAQGLKIDMTEFVAKQTDDIANVKKLVNDNFEEENVGDNNFEYAVANSQAGETVTVNGAGSGFMLPAGKSTTITFSATISTTPSSCSITNQATVSGSNISTANSNTTTTSIVIPPPTSVTTAATICNGQSISLSATCSSGTVQWYNAAAPNTLLGTSNSGESFSQSPTGNTTYQAACKVSGCESARTSSGLITVNPLPSITVGASPGICVGATSFTIPYSSPMNTPTSYSISGTGITSVTDGSLPSSPITVNLSSSAIEGTYNYTLTVKNANNCVSSVINGSVTVSAVPTITVSSSPSICAGAASFTIPYTATTGTPTTYSISGTGITGVTNGALTSSPITVNLSGPASGLSISYILTVKNAGGCTSSNVNGSVDINPLPTITTSASPAICSGANSFTIPYTATSGTLTTYSISGVGITTVTDAALPPSPITVNLSSGASGSSISYTLTVKNANGCTSSNINGSVTVNPTPASPAISSNSPVCVGGNLSLSAPMVSAATYSWTGPDSFVSGTQNPGINNVTSAASGTYSLSITVSGCTSTGSQTTVVIETTPPPTSPVASPSSVTISGTTTSLTASGCSSPAVITWYDAANPSVALANSTPAITATTTYFAKCTSANSCVSLPSSNVVVTYNPCTPLGVSPGNVNITWTGLLSNDWNTACNWNPAWVPDLSNGKVIIPNTTNKPVISSSIPDIKSIEIQASALLTINSGRVLNVRGDGGTSKGFTIAGGTVTNNGTINIESATNMAVPAYIYLQATDAVLTNNGTIKINSSDEAIGVGSVATPATINNNINGVINIVNGIGVEIALASDVTNFNNAGIINYDGSVLAFKFLGTTTFTNSGIVNINSGTGIENPSGNTITNNACGKIVMVSGNYVNGGTTTNAGLIQMPNTLNFTNTGTFTNNGVVKSNTVSGIINNKMIITNACPIFTLGGSNNYTVSGIFTNAGSTTSAGTYASVDNKFTANNTIPTGLQTLYAQVTDGTCTFVVPFDFDNNKPTAVSSNKTIACLGESVTLSAVCTSGTVTWYSTDNSSSSLGTGASFSYAPPNGAGQSFYASCESTNCSSGRVVTSNTVTITALPTATATPATQAICSGETITTIALTGTGTSYSWTRDNTSGVSGISASGSGDISGTLTNTTNSPITVTFTITPIAACSGTTTTATVVVNPIPVATASTPSQSICSGSNITGITFSIPAAPQYPTTNPSSDIVSNVNQPVSQQLVFTSAVVGTVFNWTRDNTINVSGIPASGSGNISGVLTNSTSSPVTVTFTVTPSYTNAGKTCQGTPITVTVTVNPNPVTPTITGGDATVCSSGGVELSGPSDPNFTYLWQRNYYANIPPYTSLGSSQTQTATQSGIYKLTVTNQYNCSSSVSKGVYIGDYVFNGSLVSGDATQTGRLNRFAQISICSVAKSCPGTFSTSGSRVYDSYTITNPRNAPICAKVGLKTTCGTSAFMVAYTGSFNPGAICTNYLADPGSSAEQIFMEVNIPANGTIVLVVHEVNVGTGCGSYSLVVDLPRETPGITVSPNSPICAGTPLTLTASAASTYSWTPGGATTSTINSSPSTTTTYSVTLGYGNSTCSVTATTQVVADPVTTMSSNSPICVGNTLNLSSGTASSYTWTGPNSFTSAIQNPTITNATSAASGTYTLVAVNGGCTTTATTSVIINDLPVPNPSSDSPKCVGSTLTFNSTAGMTSYVWTGPNSYSSGIQAPSINNVSTSATGIYTLIVTNSNSCSASATTAVTINQALPPIISPPPSLSVCSPSTLTLTASGCSGGIVTWSVGAITGTSLTLSAVGTYSVTATCTVNGCTSEASTAVTGLEIKAKPSAPTITPPTTLVICSPSTLTLTASGCSGGTITWSEGAVTGTSLILSAVGTYSVRATCTINGCTSDVSTSISGLIINEEVKVTTAPQNVNICQGNNASFTVQSNLTSVSYLWEVNTGSGFVPVAASSVYSGQNTATLSLAFPPVGYNGFQYRCIVSRNSCSATSTAATLSMSGSAEALNIVNVSPISGVYSQTAVAHTIALNKIEPGANVTFKSGNAIQLLPGFETRAGAVFTAKIDSPCGLTTSNISNFDNLPKEIRK